MENGFGLDDKPLDAETDAIMRWLNSENRLHTRCSEDVAPSICQLYGLSGPADPRFHVAFLRLIVYGLRLLARSEPLRDGAVFFTTVGFAKFDFEIGIMVQHHDGDAWVQVLSGEECDRLTEQFQTGPLQVTCDA